MRFRYCLFTYIAFTMMSVTAQQSLSQLSNFGEAIAIVGARIEIGNGKVIEKGTVVLRDGLIESVGVNIPVGKDIEVIKGDGLTIYPGFIDSGLQKGYKIPEALPNQDDARPTLIDPPTEMREANRKGIRPELRFSTLLDLSESTLEPIRKAGFTTALIIPNVGLIGGQSCLVNLSGRARRMAIVKSDIAMYMAFQNPGNGASFPGTLFGYFSLLRQTLLDAHRMSFTESNFRLNGGNRPVSDDSLAALTNVLSKKQLVIAEADSPARIERLGELVNEFGLRSAIYGGLESWRTVSTISKSGQPVIVGLNWGEEAKTTDEMKPTDKKLDGPKKADVKKEDPKKPDDKKEEPAKPSEDEKYLGTAVKQERRRIWEEKVANASVLAKSGVKIAFTSRGLKSHDEFWTNLRSAIKFGLARDSALAGLTIMPAQILGLEKQLGTIEPGKIANLTIMDGDFVESKTKVRYVIIDGIKFDPEAPKENSSPVTPPTLTEGRGGSR